MFIQLRTNLNGSFSDRAQITGNGGSERKGALMQWWLGSRRKGAKGGNTSATDVVFCDQEKTEGARQESRVDPRVKINNFPEKSDKKFFSCGAKSFLHPQFEFNFEDFQATDRMGHECAI